MGQRRRSAAAGLFIALSVTALPANAYRGASRSTHIFPERHLVCHEASAAAPQRFVQAGGEEILPVPVRRDAPPQLRLLDDVADDVTYVEPVPSGPRRTAERAEPPAVWVADPRNAFPCLGMVRGLAGVSRVLSAPAGARFYGHSDANDWRRDNMTAAALFNLSETIPSVREILRRPVPDPQDYERVSLRTEAAITLSALGDRDSAQQISAWLGELEAIPWNGMWSDTFDALLHLDPRQAERYSLVVLGRAARRELGDAIPSDRLEALGALTQSSSQEALPILQRLTADPGRVPFDGAAHAYCLLLGARVRLGDAQLVAEAREQMSGELTKPWAIACFSELRDALPWNDASDVPAMIHRQAYEAMLTWLGTPAGRTSERARAELRQWLRQGLTSPSVSQPDHVEFRRETRAMHLAALTIAGDDKAIGPLYDQIADPNDETDGPWIGAFYALRFGLPGAADATRKRLRWALTHSSPRAWYQSHVGAEESWRTRVIDELIRAAPADPAWTVALLDKDAATREAVLWRISRYRPSGACETVASAAAGAEDRAVMDAFWALTALGDACRNVIAPLALDSHAAPVVRGAAIEYLAMIRDPRGPALAREVRFDPDLRAAAGRALVIGESELRGGRP